ncbi:MAG: hypothetical protein QXD43_03695 [Candidatus Aenigmatarchaeota archaeon]
MELRLNETIPLNYKGLTEIYRNSNEAYCYKISRVLGQTQTFPCYKNVDNKLSNGCHAKSVIETEEPVIVRVDDFVLNKESIESFIKNNWKYLSKNNNFLEFEKKRINLDMDEWCFLNCKHNIRVSFLSDLQLKKYEVLRENILNDIKAFINEDDSFYNQILLKKSNFPKLALAIEIAKKI